MKDPLSERHPRTKLGRGHGPSAVKKKQGIFEDEFLNNFFRGQHIKLTGAFANTVRRGKFLGPAYDTLTESTVRGTVSYVSHTLKKNDRPTPTNDKDVKLRRLLSRQYRAFKNTVPNQE